MVSSDNRIEERRKALKMTRAELAAEIGETYLQVYRLETGKVKLRIDVLARIAKALKTTTAKLVA